MNPCGTWFVPLSVSVCLSVLPINPSFLPFCVALSGDPAETDYTAVGCAVTTISSNLTEMSKGVKLLAALMDDEGGNGQQLLGAAKNLACAVSEMLKTAQPANTEVLYVAKKLGRCRPVMSTLCYFELMSMISFASSLVRTCYRLQEMWARPVESCCLI